MGGEGRIGWGEEGGGKHLSSSYNLSTDSPNRVTRPRRCHSGHGNNFRMIRPIWYTPQVPMCRSWPYRVINPPIGKQTAWIWPQEAQCKDSHICVFVCIHPQATNIKTIPVKWSQNNGLQVVLLISFFIWCMPPILSIGMALATKHVVNFLRYISSSFNSKGCFTSCASLTRWSASVESERSMCEQNV